MDSGGGSAVHAHHPAAVDCERIRPGLVAQPVNAASSIAFCLSGAHLVAHADKAPDPVRARAMRAYGLALIATGIGSVLFHGPGGRLSRWAHDSPILALTAGVAAWDAYDTGLLSGATAATVAGTAVVATAAVSAVAPEVGMAGQIGVAACAFGMEAAVRVPKHWGADVTARSTPMSDGAPTWAHRLPVRDRRVERRGAALLGASALLHPLGRTGGPLCRPDSRLQPHALWHVGAATAVGMWAWAAMGPGSAPAPAVADGRVA